MGKTTRQKVLRVAVIADGQVCEEFHQTSPGHVDVGRGAANDVHVYDAHLRPADRRKAAPLWLGVGVVMVLVGVVWFGSLVAEQARLIAATEVDGLGELSDYFGVEQGRDVGLWALGIALLGMVPLISGFTALREAPPPRMPTPGPHEKPAPNSQRLFRYDENAGRYELSLDANAKGRLKLGKQSTSVEKLRKRRGDAQGRVRIVLPNEAKGELTLGASTLLFKLTRPKRVAPFLRFPTAFIDHWQYFRLTPLDLTVQLSVTVLLGGFFFALTQIEPTEREMSARMMEVMGIVKYEPPEEEVPVEEPEEEPEEEVLEIEDEEQPVEEIIDDKVIAEKPEKFSKQAMEKARGVGVVRVLGTYGGPGEGTVVDVITSTENNLGELFAQGMTQTVYSDGTGVSPFVAGGEGISAHGSMAQTQGLATGDGPAAIEEIGRAHV